MEHVKEGRLGMDFVSKIHPGLLPSARGPSVSPIYRTNYLEAVYLEKSEFQSRSLLGMILIGDVGLLIAGPSYVLAYRVSWMVILHDRVLLQKTFGYYMVEYYGKEQKDTPPDHYRFHISSMWKSEPSEKLSASSIWLRIGFYTICPEEMGKKGGGLYINPKKFGQNRRPCMAEMQSFLSCLATNQNNDDKCVKEKQLLSACVDAQSGKKKKPWGTINYHLQRLSKGKKF
eukprot:Gb_24510 [translate_table: standard]